MPSAFARSREHGEVGASEVMRAAAALPALVATDLLLRAIGYTRTTRLVELVAPFRWTSGPTDPRTEPGLRSAALAVDRAARFYRPGRMCLRRSLILWAWLRRHGVDAQVVLGVRLPAGGSLVAHAWLEWRSEPLAEPGGSSLEYAPLAGAKQEGKVR